MRHLRLWWGLGSVGLFVAAVVVSSSLAPKPGAYGPSSTLPSLPTVTTRPPTTMAHPPSRVTGITGVTVTGQPGPPGLPGPAGPPGQVVVAVVQVPVPTVPPTTTTATTVPATVTTRCLTPPSRPHPSSTQHPCLPHG